MLIILPFGVTGKVELRDAMKKFSDDKIGEKTIRGRKPYTAPILLQYGDIKNITAGGSSGKTERQPWQNQKQRP